MEWERDGRVMVAWNGDCGRRVRMLEKGRACWFVGGVCCCCLEGVIGRIGLAVD